jgi:parallel beta-helix repeat protein
MARSAKHRLLISAAKKRASGRRVAPKPGRGWARIALAAAAIASLAAVSIPFLASQSASADGYVRSNEVARDLMNTKVADGWGDAEIGGSYSYVGKSDQHKDGWSGAMKLPAAGTARSATLNSVSVRDVDVMGQIVLPTLPTKGAGIYTGLHLRASAHSYYQAQVRISPAGSMQLSILRINGSTDTQQTIASKPIGTRIIHAGTTVSIEAQITGANPVSIRARAWVTGTTMPAWKIQSTDNSDSRITTAGSVGAWSYVSKSSSGQSVHFNNIDAFALKQVPTETDTPEPSTTPSSTPSATPTASPSPTPTPTPSTTPSAPITPLPSTGGAGAAAIGSTSYAVPAGAIFVSPSGSDSASGSETAPYRTITHAINSANSGNTIVLRGGSYHESVTVPQNKTLTIQSFPKEAVWLDGSTAVSDFAQTGSNWVLPGWTTKFDHSPTFARGAADGTTAGWQFINPAYPMAAYPDQVWIDGAKQTQVGSVGALGSGKFYVDTSAQKLYLGSNPSGKAVRSADLVKALTIMSPNSKFLGIGIRDYSPSVPDIGAVSIRANNVLVQNVSVLDSATVGMSVVSTNDTVDHVTIDGAGLLGFHANYADGIVVNALRATNNNSEHFNSSPVSGGLKITRTRNVTVSNGAYLGNLGQGIWLDESVYNGLITNNVSSDNTSNGIVIEISAKIMIAGNTGLRNGGAGVKIDGISNLDIWNNTFSDNSRNINLTQGTRRASNLSTAGHDPRQSLPDPTETWINGPMRVYNNVLGASTGNCSLCVQDFSHEFTADQMGTAVDSNVFQVNTSGWAVVWSKGPGDPAVFTTVAQFAAATGRQVHSLVVSQAPADINGLMTQAVTSAASIATALPANVAAAVGEPTGSKHLGAW